MNKHADKPDAAKTFDQGHVEPDQQAKADTSEQISARGYMLSSPSYTKEYVESVAPKHKAPGKVRAAVSRWPKRTVPAWA